METECPAHCEQTHLPGTRSATPANASQALLNSPELSLVFWALLTLHRCRRSLKDREDHNLWPGRIKEFWHPPNPFVMFLHLTANRGGEKSSQGGFGSVIHNQGAAEKSMAREILSDFSRMERDPDLQQDT